MLPQTDEQRGKRACVLTDRGSISKAVKGHVGGAAQGSADCRKNWTTALIARNSNLGTHPTNAECNEAARGDWEGGRYKATRSAMREQRRNKTGITLLPHVKLAPMRAPGPTGGRQDHLDAIISFARVGQWRRQFRCIDILTIKLAIGDLPEECRFLLNTQLMFLKKEKDPTSKQFDDDEWIRSLTEAQEITADVPKDSVMFDQQVIDSKKSLAHSNERVLAEYVSRRLFTLSEGEIAALTTALATFHQLRHDEWATG